MLASFLFAVTLARAAVFTLPVGLFFAAAASPPDAPTVLATASALTIGSGLGLWPSGRLLDRIGPWRGLRWSMLGGAGSLALLTAVMFAGAPTPAVLAVAGCSGAAWAAVIATPRALLANLVRPGRLARASGIEAASVEAALISAPIAGALLGRWGAAAVPTAGALVLVAAAALLPKHNDRQRQRLTGWPVASTRVLALAGLALLVGLSGGLMEPGLAALPSPPFGDLGGNAVLFVAIGLGSAVGGLLAARLEWPHAPGHGIPLLLIHAGGLAGAATTDGLPQLALLVVAGLPFAPLQSLAGLHLDHWAGATRAAETFGMVTTALTLGTGIGQALTAQAVGRVTAQQLVLIAALPPVLAAGLVGLRWLRSRATGAKRHRA